MSDWTDDEASECRSWHGTVSDEMGGYLQELDFLSDRDVRIKVMGQTAEAKYEINVAAKPNHMGACCVLEGGGEEGGLTFTLQT